MCRAETGCVMPCQCLCETETLGLMMRSSLSQRWYAMHGAVTDAGSGGGCRGQLQGRGARVGEARRQQEPGLPHLPETMDNKPNTITHRLSLQYVQRARYRIFAMISRFFSLLTCRAIAGTDKLSQRSFQTSM